MLLGLHVVPGGHVPQLIVLPQPSGTVPHIAPIGQAVSGAQTHTLLALHVVPAGHVPQLTVPPQPFGADPHV
ncbi:MAG: hypothetical protein M3O50_10790, partial [Myxococcota bacterium]|nr:hypothetical protein [Myxococcota bacterium]